jgi:nicotinamidase-related amidase
MTKASNQSLFKMKQVFFALFLLFSVFRGEAQQTDSTALLLIDIQNFYFPGGAAELYEPEKAAENAKLLLEHFRKNKGLVVHVKHDFEPGGDIHKLVQPVKGEKVFTKNGVNAFLNTGLKDYLDEHRIKNLVLCGMQTHMCLEAATRAAHDFGFNCTVVSDACATQDITYNSVTTTAKQVHTSTLATLRNYAKVVTKKEYLEGE